MILLPRPLLKTAPVPLAADHLCQNAGPATFCKILLDRRYRALESRYAGLGARLSGSALDNTSTLSACRPGLFGANCLRRPGVFADIENGRDRTM